jgi:hypothetical protein
VKFSDEEGSAVLDFIGFGLLLQLPLVMFANNLVMAQHEQLTAEAITRDALRSHVLLGKAPLESALELADAYRIASNRIRVTIACRPANCHQEKAWIHLTTRIGDVEATGVIQR